MDIVPPTAPVKRNRVANVDSIRLVRRRRYMIENLSTIADSRMEFAYRAYELQAIENALVTRGLLSPADRRTTYGNDRSVA